MSRRGKKGRQKPTIAPAPAPQQPKARRCDDELTTIAETMRPAHRRFADGVLAGKLGARAAVDAGFAPTSARSIAYRLMRRDDVRRYIHLAQREESVAARVTLAAIVDRLWRTVTDAAASVKAQQEAMKMLVRIMVARGQGRPATGDDDDDQPDVEDGFGLTDEKAQMIEERILGVRR